MALINCKECGAQISNQATTCPKCGAPVEKHIICEDCGAEVSESMESCPKCGCPNPLFYSNRNVNVVNKSPFVNQKNGKRMLYVVLSLIVVPILIAFLVKGVRAYDDKQGKSEIAETIFSEGKNGLGLEIPKTNDTFNKTILEPGGVFLNKTNKNILVYLYPDEIEVSSDGNSFQKIRIEGYSPVFKVKDLDYINSDETFARGAKITMEADYILKDGVLYNNEGNELAKILYNNPCRVDDDGKGFYASKNGGFHINFEIKANNNIWYEGEYERCN